MRTYRNATRIALALTVMVSAILNVAFDSLNTSLDVALAIVFVLLFHFISLFRKLLPAR